MSWHDYDDYRPYARSTPRRVTGGIRAQSGRGAFGETWWAKRWVEVLERFNLGGRLARGRTYARQGQVLDIKVDAAGVRARVQGSQRTPYLVTLRVEPLSAGEWGRVIAALRAQPIFVAKLLAGEMPQEIEKAFAAAKASLFPGRRRDLKTACSCPDPSNPCKHVAAVYYLLGEEFDRDPFLLFALRGVPRGQLLKRLGEANAPAKKAAKVGRKLPRKRARAAHADPAEFWAGDDLSSELLGDCRSPLMPGALARRLGSFPFWRGRDRFLERLSLTYAGAARRGEEACAGA